MGFFADTRLNFALYSILEPEAQDWFSVGAGGSRFRYSRFYCSRFCYSRIVSWFLPQETGLRYPALGFVKVRFWEA